MSLEALLESIGKLPARSPNVPIVPEPEVVGFFVRWARGLRLWKVSTLADFAGVSVSTLERVERGERVSNENLDRIAVGLGYPSGYFTQPRLPLTEEEVLADWQERYGQTVPVKVKPLRTQLQVRRLAQCHGYLPTTGEDAELDDYAMGLVEWLDLAAFILVEGFSNPQSDARKRKLYADILAYVRKIEASGITVLAGVMDAPQDGHPDWKAALLSFRRRSADPGATKRRVILVDRRCVDIGLGSRPLPGDEK